ncbi:MAG: TolC family protein [Bdellovibrionaceae bacterium]|nr:TolC family protein [Bdellovibrionales bacterium]MCB9255218.1 TolC family protein [Pseudobdellovibrionaceae bacterium]
MSLRKLPRQLAFWSALLFWGTPSAHAALPKDAQELLRTLPQNAVTLDVVLGRAMKSSDSFEAVKSFYPKIEAPLLSAQAALDWQLSFEISKLEDRREATNAFAPRRNNTFVGKIGASKYFLTGTSLALEVTDGRTELDFPTITIAPFVEAKSSITLAQNLWRDSFGYATRRTAESGELQKKSLEHQFEDSIDDWTMELTQVFYQAWLAQARAVASADSVKRREKLVRVTRTKQKRGTAERPDVLQVESFLLSDQSQKRAADLELGNRWRDLVIALKLNEEWLTTVDPIEIPIVLDSPMIAARDDCGPPARLAPLPAPNTKVKSADLDAQAATLAAEAAENSAAPAVKVFGTIYANGVDSSGGNALNEMLGWKNPGFLVGLSFSMPLSQYAERAAARQAISNQMLAEARASIAKDQFKLGWMKACLDLNRLEHHYTLKKQAYENQSERARLEEKRFAIGRVSTLAVVQSEDDATRAELELREAEIQRRVAAWQVRRLQGKIKPYLEKLLEQISNKKFSK